MLAIRLAAFRKLKHVQLSLISRAVSTGSLSILDFVGSFFSRATRISNFSKCSKHKGVINSIYTIFARQIWLDTHVNFPEETGMVLICKHHPGIRHGN